MLSQSIGNLDKYIESHGKHREIIRNHIEIIEYLQKIIVGVGCKKAYLNKIGLFYPWLISKQVFMVRLNLLLF